MEEDVEFIRSLIAHHTDASRRKLSQLLCQAWNWVQPNGALRDMVCRGLMLELHRNGYIELQLPCDWQQVYGHPVYFLETFVDPALYKGTCYRAANWLVLGRTTGRGKDAPSMQPTRSIKEVLGYSLTKHFRKFLCGVA